VSRIRFKTQVLRDIPESDIAGGNGWQSKRGIEWETILVKTGVYQQGKPRHEPTVIVDDVYEAVQWAMEREGWNEKLPPKRWMDRDLFPNAKTA